MRKKKRARSGSKAEKREDEPPEGPIIILEPRPGGGPLIWLQQQGGNPPAPLLESSQPANGSLRSDFIGVAVISFEAGNSSFQSVEAIRATTLDATRVLEVRYQSAGSPLQWQLTHGTPPITTTFAPTAGFDPGEVPRDLTGFERLEYQAGGSWFPCLSFRFQVQTQGGIS